MIVETSEITIRALSAPYVVHEPPYCRVREMTTRQLSLIARELMNDRR